MGLRLWKTLNKVIPGLDLDVPNEEYDAVYHPTLDLPRRPSSNKGTDNLCERCLTLLHHVVHEFGQGSQLYPCKMAHSIFRLDAAQSNYSPNPKDRDVCLDGFVKRMYESQMCVICKNVKILFDTNEKRGIAMADVRITWTLQSVDPKICFRMKFPLSSIQVRIEAKQYDRYPITLGSFDLWKEGATDVNGVVVQDNPVILPLDNLLPEPAAAAAAAPNPDSDFVSTCGPSTRQMITSWMTECLKTHTACALPLRIHPSTPESYVPGRLIHVTKQSMPDGTAVAQAHLVEKSVPSDFPEPLTNYSIYYLSVSHCWGPAPDPRAPLEGRAKSVLTLANRSAWRSAIPLEDISPTALQAIMFCRSIGFDYIWIDSLCIIQDSLDDWRTQSATMGDIYRFAWCNLTALWSTSDVDGFLNFQRDPRVDFGFHASLSGVLGIAEPSSVRNGRGEECTLLHGRARLTWSFEPAHGGCTRGPAPLLNRAWVFQERHLARRTLAFTEKTVYWSCDSGDRCENKAWPTSKYGSPALRKWQRRAMAFQAAKNHGTDRDLDAELTAETAAFWTECVLGYTECKLTKPKDRLIALSSITQEVSAAGRFSKVKYLAGLWNLHLENQLLWYRRRQSTIGPEKRIFVPPRRKVGDAEYAAPTWSWASVEVSIQPGPIFHSGISRQLAFVREADVTLATDFEYGIVEAGYLRLSARLNKISSMGFTSPNNPWILDVGTSGRINFGFDTSDDLETVERETSKVRWFPIRMDFSKTQIDCRGLVVAETDEYENRRSAFIKSGDRVYKRLGYLNFGRTLQHVEKDSLLLRELGLSTQWNGKGPEEGGTYEQYVDNFRLRDEEFVEFVLV